MAQNTEKQKDIINLNEQVFYVINSITGKLFNQFIALFKDIAMQLCPTAPDPNQRILREMLT